MGGSLTKLVQLFIPYHFNNAQSHILKVFINFNILHTSYLLLTMIIYRLNGNELHSSNVKRTGVQVGCYRLFMEKGKEERREGNEGYFRVLCQKLY